MSFRFFACAGPEPLLPRIEARLADANDLVLLLRTPAMRPASSPRMDQPPWSASSSSAERVVA
jgi:hypothetical protein